MAEAPVTRITLLNRIRDANDTSAWTEFVRLYGPVIYGFGRKRGLQDADATDLVQDVLRSVARNANKLEYDPKKGTFRGWLYTIARNKVFNFLSSNRNKAKGVGDSAHLAQLEQLPETADDQEQEWELEYQRQIAAKAMTLIRSEFHTKTWKAFEGTAVEDRSAEEVGAELEMSVGAVYVAKSRVLARLRKEVQKMIAESEAW
jgi:RNA polymerase sigma-70 factor (ECF subfamily)